MARVIPGLHHVTAIASDPQENVDFYVARLGQRLVKKTVNFDDPGTYHLYYGDMAGTPGTILTFFPFVDAGPGRAGAGAASAVAYGVPDLDAWMGRFADETVDFEGPATRFGERMIDLTDPQGLHIELIEQAGSDHKVDGTPADDGFHSVTLCERDFDPTAKIVRDLFGYEEIGSEREGRWRRAHEIPFPERRTRLGDRSVANVQTLDRTTGRRLDPPCRVSRRDRRDPASMARSSRFSGTSSDAGD